MSITVEFWSKAASNAYHDDCEEYICPVDDDRRLKTVAFVSDTPEWLLGQARLDASVTLATTDGGEIDPAKRGVGCYGN